MSVAVAASPSARMEQLYAEHFTPLVDWCARRVGDRQLAEDAVQEASIQLWRRVASGDTQILDFWH